MEVGKASRFFGESADSLAAPRQVESAAANKSSSSGAEPPTAGNRLSVLARFKNWLRRNTWLNAPTQAMPRGPSSTVINETDDAAQAQRFTCCEHAKRCVAFAPVAVLTVLAAFCGVGGAGVPHVGREQSRNDSHV